MKLLLTAFTEKGAALAARLAAELSLQGHLCEAFAAEKFACCAGISIRRDSLSQWTGRAFAEAEGIVFVGACGIAVRSIAPFLCDKRRDPAVAVVDEAGRFAVSLVSGHVGGANRLAVEIAAVLGAVPVITTATDVNHVFAVDLWAKENGMLLENREAAKAVSAALLAGEQIALQSDYPVRGDFPDGLFFGEEGRLGVSISLRGRRPFLKTCLLRPRTLVLGIGCRRGIAEDIIAKAVWQALEKAELPREAVCKICSIDLKRGEKGLLAFCNRLGLPLRCFSAQELQAVSGDFSSSDFVNEITGVDNVCERAAVLGAENGSLLLKKCADQGVTVAAAERSFFVNFSHEL